MPIRTPNGLPRTGPSDRTAITPADRNVVTQPAVAPQPTRPNSGGWVATGPSPRPNLDNLRTTRAQPGSVLKAADLTPIGKRFEKLALDDGQLSRGDASELIRSLSTRRLSPKGEAEVRRAIDQYGSVMTPDARNRLQTFVARELPRLRMASPTDVNREELVGANSAILAWDPPTRNVDGSAITNLAGYKLAMGQSPGNYTRTVDVADPSAVGVVTDGLTGGAWYFAVKAYNTAGEESAYSGEVSKVFP